MNFVIATIPELKGRGFVWVCVGERERERERERREKGRESERQRERADYTLNCSLASTHAIYSVLA
jgi:hypothetical protein